MVGGDFVPLATFRVAESTSAFRSDSSLRSHIDDRRDPRERVTHRCDKRAITETDQRIYLYRIEERARLVGVQNGVLPRCTTYFAPRTEAAGFIGTICPITLKTRSSEWPPGAA